MRELLLGCGFRTIKNLYNNANPTFQNVTRLDINARCNPDVIHDLSIHPLPFPDETFDEIHAYEVLEHLAQQGDYKFFFSEFSEYWRILKPGGYFFATVPSIKSVWAWGDPSHRRVIPITMLTFLVQEEYEKQSSATPLSDFRDIYKVNFEIMAAGDDGTFLKFVLKKK